jgi:inosine/xanthosine triphosphate pyrophosphatase family protein
MKILYATQNAAKVRNMRRRLAGTGVEIVTPDDLNLHIEIEEDGSSVAENAMKKAEAYALEVSLPVLAADSGLWINGLPDAEQPGMYVRRVNGQLLTDDEMIDHYAALAARLGGRRKAHYVTGLAMISNGKRFCQTVPENEFLLVSRPNPNRFHTGNPIDVIAVDPATGSYHNTLPDSAFKDAAWTFERACRKFVTEALSTSQ